MFCFFKAVNFLTKFSPRVCASAGPRQDVMSRHSSQSWLRQCWWGALPGGFCFLLKDHLSCKPAARWHYATQRHFHRRQNLNVCTSDLCVLRKETLHLCRGRLHLFLYILFLSFFFFLNYHWVVPIPLFYRMSALLILAFQCLIGP